MLTPKKNVLLTDDDAAVLDVMTIILEEAGYSVSQARNGEDVLSKEKHQPDLILLDLSMAGMNGSVVCEHLKSQPSTQHIPVIIVSANNDIKEISERVGADGYLSKPFDMDDLVSTVEKYIG